MKPPPPARKAFLASCAYAHRGLHRPGGPPENSMAAFEAALAAGYGIECDVRLSQDGAVYIFHDEMLKRLTGQAGRFANRTAAQIDATFLRDGSPIPRLSALLGKAGSQAPLLIELKAPNRAGTEALCKAVAQELATFKGQAAIMSFNPLVGAWFAAHAPEHVRGLVVTEEEDRTLFSSALRRLDYWRARPDFLAYDIRSLPSPFAARARAKGLPVLSWTVRTDEERARAAACVDTIIFENRDG